MHEGPLPSYNVMPSSTKDPTSVAEPENIHFHTGVLPVKEAHLNWHRQELYLGVPLVREALLQHAHAGAHSSTP